MVFLMDSPELVGARPTERGRPQRYWKARSGRCIWPDQGDGPFGARNDAQATSAAGIGVRRVGSLAPMGEHAQLGQGVQWPEVAVVDSPYFEHVVRAHDNTIPFGFASSVIDDRGPGPRHRVAPLPGASRILRRPTFLGSLLRRFS